MPASNPIGLPITIVAPGQPFLSAAIPVSQTLCTLALNGSAWTPDVNLRARLLVAEDGINFEEVGGMGGVPAHLNINHVCSIQAEFAVSNPQRAVKCAVDVTQGSITLIASLIPATPDIIVNPINL